MITLITGGARSGKSSYALELAEPYHKRVFLATAEAIDTEMQDRIENHQAERGDSFETIEEPLALANVLRNLPEGTDLVLVDCLTVWVGNLLHKHGEDEVSFVEVTDFLNELENPPCDIIMVTNEVGMGIVPDNKLSRVYRDIAGRLTQMAAAVSDRVVLTVAGIPMELKK
ncbi:bifunctional adenosylcobinamide kinase/adenosylcobinamide-phosphate guanylyltransferase [bacterium E08(2017)]|nr:bifunctional adenosylcobinamide kinase/adenosylcobinamide-phosphate guanylyltransferase [bacterium E08(2017)]